MNTVHKCKMKIWIVFLAITHVHSFPSLEHVHAVANKTHATSHSVEITEIKPPYFGNDIDESNNDTSNNSFPAFITTGQWREGSAFIAALIGIYCFTFLALICDKYFLPCIERICEALDLSQDVAAATFMAMATSAPEFFVNVIATFITKSDIGVGTVIGSSIFNTLGVAALGGLAASKPIQVDWWPVTRDCTIYLISISILVIMTWDGIIFWYEGLILFLVYFIYFGIMFNNSRISEAVRDFVKKLSSTKEKIDVNTKAVEASKAPSPQVYIINEPIQYYKETKENHKINNEKCTEKSIVTKRTCGFYLLCIWSVFISPLKLLLWCIVPNPTTNPKLYPLTFIICIVLIGTNSYVVSWMISIIGLALQVPDVLLGLTFLAAGGCLPEAVSIIIMSRKGNGRMGVSNALGANSMNILLSLGLPWFVKTLMLTADSDPKKFIELESDSIVYTIMGLILIVLALFVILFLNKFRLSRCTGSLLLVTYLLFLCLAISTELFFQKSVTS